MSVQRIFEMTKAGWVPVDKYNNKVIELGDTVYEKRTFCEAPRHKGSFTAAEYVFAITGADDPRDDLVQAMCKECMDMIASDLGTTAEDGVMSDW